MPPPASEPLPLGAAVRAPRETDERPRGTPVPKRLPRQPARPPRHVPRQLRQTEERRRLAARVVREAHGAVFEHDAVAQDAAGARRQGEAALRERLEVALELPGGDELRARDVDERPAVARGAAVVGHAQREPRAGDRAGALHEEEVVGGRPRATAAKNERRRRASRRSAPRHTATATPPRRGSPAPDSSPVAGSRSTACTPPKNRFSERNATSSRPAARSSSRASPGSAYTRPSSKCTRGAMTASCAARPWSTAPTMTCRIAERIRFEPALPSTSSTSPPSPTTAVGAIIDGIRRPGGKRKKPSGLRSCSPMMLLTWMPVPGTTMPAPSPFVHVTAHARPSASITEMCVVEPRRDARKRS